MTSQEFITLESIGQRISLNDGSHGQISITRDPNGDSTPEARLNSTGVEPPNQEPVVLTWRFYLIFVALAIVSLAAALDSTSLTVALPTITHDLHGTGIEEFWAGTAYLLTLTVVQPPIASLSHIFGRKPLVCIGFSIVKPGYMRIQSAMFQKH
jgi:hypothetical protein